MKALIYRVVLVAAFSFAITGTAIADSDSQSPSSSSNDASIGAYVWSTDGLPEMATLVALSSPVTSNYLVLTGLGFAVPSGAMIDGIEVSIERHATLTTCDIVRDEQIRLVKAGTIAGDDNATGSGWPASTAAAVYGSSSDLWGLAWTPADVNAANFGVAIAATGEDAGNAATCDAYVDAVQVTLYYSTVVSTSIVSMSTTTMPATTTTLPLALCPATLDTAGCEAGFEKGGLKISEKTAGKEKLQAKMQKGDSLSQSAIGDLTNADSGPAVALCVYDEGGMLAGELTVDRAGDTCSGKPCWKSSGGDYPNGRGFSYKDKLLADDGVGKMKYKFGDSDKSAAQVGASNKVGTMPLGLAALLENDQSATIQVRGSTPASCLSFELTEVKKSSSIEFQAK